MRRDTILTYCQKSAAALLLSISLGCSKSSEKVHPDAPVIYDFNQRSQFSRTTLPWTRLLPFERHSAPYLGDGWGEIRDPEDEDRYQWASKKTAVLYFDSYSSSSLNLTVRGFPYTRSYQKQTLKVYLNGRFCGKEELKPGRHNFQNYHFNLPEEFLVHGENTLEFRFRYASSRRGRSMAFREILLADGQQEPKVQEGLNLTSPKGWRLTPGRRVSWRMVVPRHGYLRYQSMLSTPSADSSVHIYLRTGRHRTELARISESQKADEIISLAAFGGQRAELEFELHGPSSSEALWPVCEVGGIIEPRDVNIHIHTVDTLRPDRLGVYGYSKPISPNIDQLAAQGSLFRKAFTCSNFSISSHMSMFTGRYPQSHGIVHNGLEVNGQQITLAEMLNKQGFLSACFTHWQFLSWGSTSGKGFTSRNPVPPNPQKVEMGPGVQNVYAKAGMWVDRNWRDRQFLWTHSQFMHMKGVPEPYRSRWFDPTPPTPDGAPLTHIYRDVEDEQAKILFQESAAQAGEVEPDSLASLNAIYDGAIQLSDDFIGAFTHEVNRQGLLPFTAVILLSDHGLSIGEELRITHLGPPYEHFMHIPMIMILPGLDKPMKPEIDGLSETVDLAPTLLSYLGLDIPRRIQGVDLMPLIRGEKETVKEQVFFCLGRSQGRRWYGIRDENWLYYSDYDKESALMSVADSSQVGIKPVNHQHPEEVNRLDQRLAEWIQKTPVVSDRSEGEMTDEVKALLIKAGYLGKDGKEATQ